VCCAEFAGVLVIIFFCGDDWTFFKVGMSDVMTP
jgi:hypothetical protein